MRVLVTGGYGFLGSSLQRLCPGYTYIDSSTVDLRRPDDVFRFFQENPCDVVVHLASRVGGLYENMRSQFDMLAENTLIHTNVVKAVRVFKIKKLVNILSTCVFPDVTDIPLNAKNILNGPPHFSNEGYAYSKRYLYTLSKHLKSTTVINLIPTNLYGPGDNFNVVTAHVIPALVAKFGSGSSKVLVEGDGSALRQFLYADDFSKIIQRVVEEINQPRDIIVSPPRSHEISIRGVVDIISKESGFEGVVEFTRTDNGQPYKTCEASDVFDVFPGFEFTPLVIGLRKTIRSYRPTLDWGLSEPESESENESLPRSLADKFQKLFGSL